MSTNTHTKNRKFAKGLSWFLLFVFLTLLLMVIQTYIATSNAVKKQEHIQEIRDLAIAETLGKEDADWSHGMLDINPDYKGWLKVCGTKVDFPVVMGETNGTYLRTDFYGKKDIAGTPFLDENTDLSEDGNRIIYGHMMYDDTMFGTLRHFKSPDFFEKNRFITWEDEQGMHEYEIFAVMVVPGDSNQGGFVDFRQWSNVMSPLEKEDMLEVISQKASLYRKPWVNPDDTFMFLVTCTTASAKENKRMVIVGSSM